MATKSIKNLAVDQGDGQQAVAGTDALLKEDSGGLPEWCTATQLQTFVNANDGALASKDAVDSVGEIKPLGRVALVGGATHTITEADHLRVIYTAPSAGGTPGDITITIDDQANITDSFMCWISVQSQAAGVRVILKAFSGQEHVAKPASGGDLAVDDTNGVYIGLADADPRAMAVLNKVHGTFDAIIVSGAVRKNPTDDLRFGTIVPTNSTGAKTYADDDHGQDFVVTSGTQTFGATANFADGFYVNIWNRSGGSVTIDGVDADHTLPNNGVCTVKRLGDGSLVCNGSGGDTLLDAS